MPNFNDEFVVRLNPEDATDPRSYERAREHQATRYIEQITMFPVSLSSLVDQLDNVVTRSDSHSPNHETDSPDVDGA